ncbi:MAG: hypothetical protein L0H24_03495 [Microlunatus sp.]|nr:hypothetical protein [Microlunatus sp.]
MLLGAPPQGIALDLEDRQALAALADAGLVPPLRLVPGARRVESVPGRLEGTESG